MKKHKTIESLEEKLRKEMKRLEDNFVYTFLELLKTYPIYTFLEKRQLEELMKNIWQNSDKDPIVVEIYKEYKKIKKTETKNKEEIYEGENIENM